MVGDFVLPWAPFGPPWAPVGPGRLSSASVVPRRLGPLWAPVVSNWAPVVSHWAPVVSLWAPMVSHWAPVGLPHPDSIPLRGHLPYNNNDNNNNSPGQLPIGVLDPLQECVSKFPDRAKWAPQGSRRRN